MEMPIEQQVHDDKIQPTGYPAANRYPPQAIISTRLRDVVHRVPMTCQNALPDQEPIISVGVCECVRDISTFWLTTAHVDWNASLPLAHTSRCCCFFAARTKTSDPNRWCLKPILSLGYCDGCWRHLAPSAVFGESMEGTEEEPE